MVRFITFLPAVLLLGFATSQPVLGQSWFDLKVRIDRQYSIYEDGELDIGICLNDGTRVLEPGNYPNTGPLVEYADFELAIVTRHHGLSLAAPKLPQVDHAVDQYFLLEKGTQAVHGPMDLDQILNHPSIKNRELNWHSATSNLTFYLAVCGIVLALIFLVSMVTMILIMTRGSKKAVSDL